MEIESIRLPFKVYEILNILTSKNFDVIGIREHPSGENVIFEKFNFLLLGICILV